MKLTEDFIFEDIALDLAEHGVVHVKVYQLIPIYKLLKNLISEEGDE